MLCWVDRYYQEFDWLSQVHHWVIYAGSDVKYQFYVLLVAVHWRKAFFVQPLSSQAICFPSADIHRCFNNLCLCGTPGVHFSVRGSGKVVETRTEKHSQVCCELESTSSTIFGWEAFLDWNIGCLGAVTPRSSTNDLRVLLLFIFLANSMLNTFW